MSLHLSSSLARCRLVLPSRSSVSLTQLSNSSVTRDYATHSRTWQDKKAQREQETRSNESRAMERNFTRSWKVGDVYAPHDLSAAEARKWKKRYSPTTDAFDALSINPLDMYKNFSVMAEYVTEMGRIRPQSSTGLRRVNQRKIAKAIRRAIALGLTPAIHKHPEIIRHQEKDRFEKSGGRSAWGF